MLKNKGVDGLRMFLICCSTALTFFPDGLKAVIVDSVPPEGVLEGEAGSLKTKNPIDVIAIVPLFLFFLSL